MLDLSQITYKHLNSHDVEGPALCQFLRMFSGRIDSVLDVGADYSHAHYALDVRRLVKKYDAIDILLDPKVAAIVDRYYVGNVTTAALSHYDCVFSMSAIEHCGITTYKADSHREEQERVVAKIFQLSSRFVFLTFPYGLAGGHHGQYQNITPDVLLNLRGVAAKLGFLVLTEDFYYNPHSQQQRPWSLISKQEAGQVPYDPNVDVQCIGIVSWIYGRSPL